MRNVTSTVYYINSLPDWFYIKDSVKTMSSYWWVTDIVVLHTDPKRPDYFGELEEEYFKVTEHWTMELVWQRKRAMSGLSAVILMSFSLLF